MKTTYLKTYPLAEVMDLTVTQAIERYIEMPPLEAREAIISEWHEQLAVMLMDFIFNAAREDESAVTTFVQMPRFYGDSNYIVPYCRLSRDLEAEPDHYGEQP